MKINNKITGLLMIAAMFVIPASASLTPVAHACDSDDQQNDPCGSPYMPECELLLDTTIPGLMSDITTLQGLVDDGRATQDDIDNLSLEQQELGIDLSDFDACCSGSHGNGSCPWGME